NLLLLLSISYIPLVVCIASFSSLWIPAVYGKDWLEMGGVLKLAAIPVCGIALLSIFYSALMSVEKYDIVLKQNILHGAVYWIAMAFLVKPLGALSVPATHIIAMLASSYLFVYGYNKYCGKIKYLYVSVFFSVNILMLAATHLLLKHNLPVAAVGLWVLFIVFIGVGIKKQVMPMIAEQR
ncbi:MAG: hypothetical protein WCI43_01915, partial [Candidatus Firestonebacteria bacterium]